MDVTSDEDNNLASDGDEKIEEDGMVRVKAIIEE
jgi:hypothetical protein